MKKPALAILATLTLIGCGSSEPQHEVKPLTERPQPSVEAKNLKTPEEKIKYIEESNAPQSVKDQAIAQIKAGKL